MAATYPIEGTPERSDFGLRIGGREVEPLVRLDVLEVDVAEEINRHARATLLVKNWNPDTNTVKHSDGTVFVPGADIDISMGWQSALEPVFAGVITGVTGHFGAGGSGPTLEVACRSRSSLLALAPRARVFEEVSDGDIATDLAGRYGLTAATVDGITQPQVAYAGHSDWDWLLRRAQRLGWVTYVRDRELVFRPAAGPGGDDLVLEFGTTLAELRLEQDLRHRRGSTRATAWSSADLTAVSADADSARAEPPSGDRPTPTDAVGDSGWPLREVHRTSAAEAGSDEVDRWAVAAAGDDVLAHISGRGATIGVPKLRSDSWLQVGGIGTRFGGKHYVTGVRHRIGRRGFSTEFQLGRPEPLRPPDPAQAADRLVLGVVEDLDDPVGWGRVKVSFPWQTEAPEAIWARLATADAGPGHGTLFVPDIGQEVLVGYVDGDPRFPVVLGSLWNGRQQVPDVLDTGANTIRAILTRSGHTLSFDDTEPGSARLTTSAGHALVLDDDAKKITVTHSGGANSLTISGEGIELRAGQGDITLSAAAGKVTIEASGIEAKSTGPAKVESTATLDLKAAASLSVNGALVKIN